MLRVLKIEKETLAVLAYCASQGKTKCRAVSEILKNLRGGSAITP